MNEFKDRFKKTELNLQIQNTSNSGIGIPKETYYGRVSNQTPNSNQTQSLNLSQSHSTIRNINEDLKNTQNLSEVNKNNISKLNAGLKIIDDIMKKMYNEEDIIMSKKLRFIIKDSIKASDCLFYHSINMYNSLSQVRGEVNVKNLEEKIENLENELAVCKEKYMEIVVQNVEYKYKLGEEVNENIEISNFSSSTKKKNEIKEDKSLLNSKSGRHTPIKKEDLSHENIIKINDHLKEKFKSKLNQYEADVLSTKEKLNILHLVISDLISKSEKDCELLEKANKEIKELKKFDVTKDKIILHKAYKVNEKNHFALISDQKKTVYEWIDVNLPCNMKVLNHINEVSDVYKDVLKYKQKSQDLSDEIANLKKLMIDELEIRDKDIENLISSKFKYLEANLTESFTLKINGSIERLPLNGKFHQIKINQETKNNEIKGLDDEDDFSGDFNYSPLQIGVAQQNKFKVQSQSVNQTKVKIPHLLPLKQEKMFFSFIKTGNLGVKVDVEKAQNEFLNIINSISDNTDITKPNKSNHNLYVSSTQNLDKINPNFSAILDEKIKFIRENQEIRITKIINEYSGKTKELTLEKQQLYLTVKENENNILLLRKQLKEIQDKELNRKDLLENLAVEESKLHEKISGVINSNYKNLNSFEELADCIKEKNFIILTLIDTISQENKKKLSDLSKASLSISENESKLNIQSKEISSLKLEIKQKETEKNIFQNEIKLLKERESTLEEIIKGNTESSNRTEKLISRLNEENIKLKEILNIDTNKHFDWKNLAENLKKTFLERETESALLKNLLLQEEKLHSETKSNNEFLEKMLTEKEKLNKLLQDKLSSLEDDFKDKVNKCDEQYFEIQNLGSQLRKALEDIEKREIEIKENERKKLKLIEDKEKVNIELKELEKSNLILNNSLSNANKLIEKKSTIIDRMLSDNSMFFEKKTTNNDLSAIVSRPVGNLTPLNMQLINNQVDNEYSSDEENKGNYFYCKTEERTSRSNNNKKSNENSKKHSTGFYNANSIEFLRRFNDNLLYISHNCFDILNLNYFNEDSIEELMKEPLKLKSLLNQLSENINVLRDEKLALEERELLYEEKIASLNQEIGMFSHKNKKFEVEEEVQNSVLEELEEISKPKNNKKTHSFKTISSNEEPLNEDDLEMKDENDLPIMLKRQIAELKEDNCILKDQLENALEVNTNLLSQKETIEENLNTIKQEFIKLKHKEQDLLNKIENLSKKTNESSMIGNDDLLSNRGLGLVQSKDKTEEKLQKYRKKAEQLKEDNNNLVSQLALLKEEIKNSKFEIEEIRIYFVRFLESSKPKDKKTFDEYTQKIKSILKIDLSPSNPSNSQEIKKGLFGMFK